jgi:hypothetical protein
MKFSYSNINMIAVSKIWEIMHNDSEGKKPFISENLMHSATKKWLSSLLVLLEGKYLKNPTKIILTKQKIPFKSRCISESPDGVSGITGRPTAPISPLRSMDSPSHSTSACTKKLLINH